MFRKNNINVLFQIYHDNIHLYTFINNIMTINNDI